MQARLKAVFFWALIALSVFEVLRVSTVHPWNSVRSIVIVLPVVFFGNWFRGRFAGPKNNIATVVFCSAMCAVGTGMMEFWIVVLLRRGGSQHGDVTVAAIVSAGFVVCSLVFFWSLRRLLRPDGDLAT